MATQELDNFVTTETETSAPAQAAEAKSPEPKIEVATDDKPESSNAKTDPQEAKADDSGSEPKDDRDEKGRFKGVQNRIDELTRARREAEREAQYWRGLAAPEKAAKVDEKPALDGFDDYTAYVEALTGWKAARAVDSRMQEDSGRREQNAAAQAFQARQEDARKAIADYDAVVSAADAPVADHVTEVLLDSAQGPQLTYHLAKNPDILESLNRMKPLQAARMLGEIEATLKTSAPAKRTTNTPAPAGAAVSTGRATSPTLENASMDDYLAMRKSQGARWAR